VFLNTAYLNQVEPFPFDLWGLKWQGKTPAEHYRPLSVSQCRAMQAGMLIDLGAHTHTHQDFRGRAQEFRNDLLINIAHLHEQFGIERPMFAFPFGSPHLNFAGGELERMARTCGVTCGLTTKCDLINALEDDPFRWGRLNVFAWDTANTLAGKLAGWYSWAPELRQKFAQVIQTTVYFSSMQIAQQTNLLSEV
jgi:hypothetical protein